VGIGLDIPEGQTEEEASLIDTRYPEIFGYVKYDFEKKHSKWLRSSSELPNVTRGLNNLKLSSCFLLLFIVAHYK
jgi:hypothetical protein